MSFEFRQMTPDDERGFHSARSWVYSGRELEGEGWTPAEGATRWVVRSGEEVVSVADIVPYQFLVRGQVISSGGVAGVGTVAEARRTGAASALMQGLVRSHAEMGMGLSCLYPFRETYYRRFGYATCGWRWQISSPAARMPQVKSDLPIRRIEPAQAAELLNPVYDSFVSQLSGCHVRNQSAWQARFGQIAPAIYAVGDPVEAYLWAKIEGFWGDVQVGEIAWTTGAGYRGLMAVLAGLSSNQNSVTWMEPPSSPFLSLLLDQGMSASQHRPTMYRITDIKVAFAGMTSAVPFSFEVKDPLIASNQGIWTLGPNGLEQGGDPCFCCSISTLTQALLGQPSLQQLGLLGEAVVLKENSFLTACHALPAQQAICMEFF